MPHNRTTSTKHPLRATALFLLAVLAVAASAHAAPPRLYVGATEDAAKNVDPAVAQAKMDLAKLAGLDVVRLSTVWTGASTPAPEELLALSNAAAAAHIDGIRPIVSIYQFSRNTPVTAAARHQSAAYAAELARALPTVKDFIVGNEPNLNLFWMPQFNPDGSDAAAPAYEALLAETYDALKAVDPTINVIGGSVSPRGQDKFRSGRQTHSPTTFIPDIGKAYRASGRTKPIMDMFAFHPYGDNSSQAPKFAHPRSTSIGLADYGKLVGLLRRAFAGTAQRGGSLPIVYDEYGIDSVIPASKTAAYSGSEPAATRPVHESLQGSRYREAIRMAACQPNVRILLIFHVSDEPDLGRWQSGMYYADDTPKESLAPVRSAAQAAAAGGCRS